MTIIDKSHARVVHHTDLLVDRHVGDINARGMNHVHTPETQYTSSFRPPSRPRDSRPFRYLSHSETKNKIITIQTEKSNSPMNFEVHMYHPTEMTNVLTPPSWFYSLYLHSPERYNKNDHPSSLQMHFY